MIAPRDTGAPRTPRVPWTLRRVFDALDAVGVEWCVLGGDGRVGTAPGDIYLLLPRADSSRCRRVFARHGFIPIRGAGLEAHNSFIGYDERTDGWVTLHVVTDPRWRASRRPALPDGRGTLRRRRSDDAPVLEDGEAFWLLLLKSLLDTSEIGSTHRAQLRELAESAAASDELGAIVDRVASPDVTSESLLRSVQVGDWAALEAMRPLLRSRFQAPSSGHAAARWLNALRAPLRTRGLTVALVGPDGSGKSTLTAILKSAFPFAVETLYMGMHRDALASTRGDRPPSLPARFVAQWSRYAKARSLSASGSMVIFDRYPVDATLPGARPASPGRRAIRWLIGHSVPAPDLMIMLDAPAEVLIERKHEQPLRVLERRRRQYLKLAERRPGTIVLDATADLEDLRRGMTRAIWEACRRRSRSVHVASLGRS